MNDTFRNKEILIFSPQPWNYLNISKHHYARELALHNKVYFISAPVFNSGNISEWIFPESGKQLAVLHYNLSIPARVKFYLPRLYQFFVKRKLVSILKSSNIAVDICIDFGCYSEFNNMNFINAAFKLFFPVDDNNFIKDDSRGADLVISVSKNIVEKFLSSGKKSHFINHGLSNEFAQLASRNLEKESNVTPTTLRFGFAGNIFSQFMDFDVFEVLVKENPNVVFELFGDMKQQAGNARHQHWDKFIRKHSNIILRGIVTPEQLAKEYESMDGFLLCYKPDYINYHAENSHKILEYLSAGKILVSTYVSIYKDSGLIAMTDKDHNNDLPELFKKVITNISLYNQKEKRVERIMFALENTYRKQIERIAYLYNNLNN